MGRLNVVKRPHYAVASVDSALQVLLMMQERDGVRVSEVASRIGSTPSTAHRILSTLVYRGFAEQDGSRRYFLGPAMKGVATGPNALEVVLRPHLVKLRDETGETVNAMVREGMSVRVLTTIESAHAEKVTNRVGTTLPLETSSTGRAMLAHLSRAELHHLFTGRQAALSESTLSPRRLAELEAELEPVRATGFAYNVQLTETELAAVACAVPSPGRTPWLAVAIAVPVARSATLHTSESHRALRQTVGEIAEDLNQRGIAGHQVTADR